eukprot:Filipodium_phascolosomae@DN527_c0_g1_i2.p1
MEITDVGGYELVSCLMLSEPSTILLNIRYFIRPFKNEIRFGYLTLYDVVSIQFVVIFVLFRTIVGPVIVWNCLWCDRSHLLIKVCGSCLTLMSVYWGYRLVLKMAKKIVPLKKHNSPTPARSSRE